MRPGDLVKAVNSPVPIQSYWFNAAGRSRQVKNQHDQGITLWRRPAHGQFDLSRLVYYCQRCLVISVIHVEHLNNLETWVLLLSDTGTLGWSNRLKMFNNVE